MWKSFFFVVLKGVINLVSGLYFGVDDMGVWSLWSGMPLLMHACMDVTRRGGGLVMCV